MAMYVCQLTYRTLCFLLNNLNSLMETHDCLKYKNKNSDHFTICVLFFFKTYNYSWLSFKNSKVHFWDWDKANAQQKALFILYLPFLPELPRLFAQHLDLPTLQQELWAPTLHTGLNFSPGFIFCCFSFRRFTSVIVTFLTLSPIFSRLRWLSLSSFLPSQSDLPLDRSVKLL